MREQLYDTGEPKQTRRSRQPSEWGPPRPRGRASFNEIPSSFKTATSGAKFDFNLALADLGGQRRDLVQEAGATARRSSRGGAVDHPIPATSRSGTAAILFGRGGRPEQPGSIYAVWQDTPFNRRPFDTVALSRRRPDGGADVVRPPIQVSKTPPGGRPGFQPAFPPPSIEVNTRPAWLRVSYYDFRNDVPGTTADELADHFVVTCAPSCAQAASFTAEVGVTDAVRLPRRPAGPRSVPGRLRGFGHRRDGLLPILLGHAPR